MGLGLNFSGSLRYDWVLICCEFWFGILFRVGLGRVLEGVRLLLCIGMETMLDFWVTWIYVISCSGFVG